MQPRVLVIEENPSLLCVAEHALAFAGYDVAATTHGEDAIALFDMIQPEVVVTDLIMQETDSLDTIAELRLRDPDTSIIAISDNGYLLELAAKAGADFVLAKPFAPEDLMFLIDAALTAPAESLAR